jgi:hypothetical protein
MVDVASFERHRTHHAIREMDWLDEVRVPVKLQTRNADYHFLCHLLVGSG